MIYLGNESADSGNQARKDILRRHDHGRLACTQSERLERQHRIAIGTLEEDPIDTSTLRAMRE